MKGRSLYNRMHRLLYPLYLSEICLLAWAIHRVLLPHQSDSVITAYLSIMVALISAFIAQMTLHYSLYLKDEARKAESPYLLLVGRRFELSDETTAWHGRPEFDWQPIPLGVENPKVRYGFLNKGEEVVITQVNQKWGWNHHAEAQWETFSMSETTRWMGTGTGRGYNQVPYQTKEAARCTPVLSTWLNVLCDFGKVIEIRYINSRTKDIGKIRLTPESLLVASLEFHKQQREAGKQKTPLMKPKVDASNV